MLFGFPEVSLIKLLKETEYFRHWVEVLFKYLNPFCKSFFPSSKVVLRVQYINNQISQATIRVPSEITLIKVKWGKRRGGRVLCCPTPLVGHRCPKPVHITIFSRQQPHSSPAPTRKMVCRWVHPSESTSPPVTLFIKDNISVIYTITEIMHRWPRTDNPLLLRRYLLNSVVSVLYKTPEFYILCFTYEMDDLPGLKSFQYLISLFPTAAVVQVGFSETKTYYYVPG